MNKHLISAILTGTFLCGSIALSTNPVLAQSTLGNLTEAQRMGQRMTRLDIEALNVEFAYQLDNGHPEVLADFFTEQASLGAAGSERAVGRAAIAKRYAARPAGRTTRHVTSNLRLVFESPSRVLGIRTLTYYATDGTPSKASSPLGVAEYNEIYERGADGAWRYASRTVTPIFGLNASDSPVSPAAR